MISDLPAKFSINRVLEFRCFRRSAIVWTIRFKRFVFQLMLFRRSSPIYSCKRLVSQSLNGWENVTKVPIGWKSTWEFLAIPVWWVFVLRWRDLGKLQRIRKGVIFGDAPHSQNSFSTKWHVQAIIRLMISYIVIKRSCWNLKSIKTFVSRIHHENESPWRLLSVEPFRFRYVESISST